MGRPKALETSKTTRIGMTAVPDRLPVVVYWEADPIKRVVVVASSKLQSIAFVNRRPSWKRRFRSPKTSDLLIKINAAKPARTNMFDLALTKKFS